MNRRAAHMPPIGGAASAARQPFHHPRTSLGATGHWLKTAGILAPLVIGELVDDAEKRWRWTRMAAVATALVSEGLWAHRVARQHEERRSPDR